MLCTAGKGILHGILNPQAAYRLVGIGGIITIAHVDEWNPGRPGQRDGEQGAHISPPRLVGGGGPRTLQAWEKHKHTGTGALAGRGLRTVFWEAWRKVEDSRGQFGQDTFWHVRQSNRALPYTQCRALESFWAGMLTGLVAPTGVNLDEESL